MKPILVIGAKGMLGRDLLPLLQSSFMEREVVGWDIEEIDIREEKSTRSKVETLNPETVINIAAYTDVDGCEKNREAAFQVNAEGMRHVALGAKACGAKVVYMSTDYIFDGKKKEPYLETDLPNPLSVYGQTKLKGEEVLQKGIDDHLIIRTQWLYGRHGKNFVASILRQAREKRTLTVVDDQTGSPTYTVDLSRAITGLLRQKSRGIFHVVNQGNCTWYTLSQAVMNFAQIEGITLTPVSSEALGRPALRPSYSVLDTQKLERETGMRLRHWADALKEYLNFICQERHFL